MDSQLKINHVAFAHDHQYHTNNSLQSHGFCLIVSMGSFAQVTFGLINYNQKNTNKFICRTLSFKSLYHDYVNTVALVTLLFFFISTGLMLVVNY